MLRRLFYYKNLNLSTFLFLFLSFSGFYQKCKKQILLRTCFLHNFSHIIHSFLGISVHSEHRADLLIDQKYYNRDKHSLEKIERRNSKHHKCKQIRNM